MGFFGKVTGMDYMDGNASSREDPSKEKDKKKEARASTGLSKQDEKLLKNIEQTVKKVNDQLENVLESVRRRRGF